MSRFIFSFIIPLNKNRTYVGWGSGFELRILPLLITRASTVLQSGNCCEKTLRKGFYEFLSVPLVKYLEDKIEFYREMNLSRKYKCRQF